LIEDPGRRATERREERGEGQKLLACTACDALPLDLAPGQIPFDHRVADPGVFEPDGFKALKVLQFWKEGKDTHSAGGRKGQEEGKDTHSAGSERRKGHAQRWVSKRE
jgi:hypothetical protein